MILQLLQDYLVFSLPQSYYQSFLQDDLVPLIEECYLEAKIWTQGMLVVTEMSLLLGPLS